MDEAIIKQIEELLKNTAEPQWQTASRINAQIQSPEYGVKAIELLLIDHFKTNRDAKIRYSALPSRKNLQVLWGHVDRVKKRRLFDIYKEDQVMTPGYLSGASEDRNLFLSHSFADTDGVFRLAEQLVQYQLFPWMAEVDLNYGGHINHEVIKSIRTLPFFGIYLSKNVLNSAWSAKEFEFAIRNKRKLFAFIDAAEHDIIAIIETGSKGLQTNAHTLLKKIFDRGEFSDQMNFFILPGTGNISANFKRIKPLSMIPQCLI